MSLQDMKLKKEYRSFKDNIAEEFYIPLLSLANLYQRAVGFFSSTALCVITPGLKKFVDNGGKIQLVASPKLSDEDYEAIEKGYKAREVVIREALLREMTDALSQQEADRLKLLADLIASEVLDIRIVTTTDENNMGMYHEKLGLIHDIEGNTVAFSGSMNESSNAIKNNYEAFDVFCSWDDSDLERVLRKQASFDAIWQNLEPGIEVVTFFDIKKEFVSKYQKQKLMVEETSKATQYNNHGFISPENVSFYDYQIEAMKAWQDAGYKGIFDMATGTGKTFTGLGAVALLCENVDELAIIIVCPFQHLVEQWVEDIRKFGMTPIIGYSGSMQRDFKARLKRAILDFKLGVTSFFCFVCTNATFASAEIQLEIKKVADKAVLVVDEAHNFGAETLGQTLRTNFKYRLALSATLDRHNDEEGTALLYQFFGEKCIEYSLERAIKEGKLTPYYYHPVCVCLTDDELEKFEELTIEISRCMVKKKNGKTELNERGKKLAIKRARLIAGAVEKVTKLKELMQEHLDDKNMLVYCGASRLLEQTTEEIDITDDIRQIDYISRMLNFELNMETAQFTSKENMAERKRRIENFIEGNIQALVAIKCLDEGVNIPAIQTAFILASTTNPKEYIQRRGRVLRLFPGKEYAVIYDFVTLPRPLDQVPYGIEENNGDLSLVKNELRRMYEFGRLSRNEYEAVHLMEDIADAYSLYDFIEGLSDEETVNAVGDERGIFYGE